MDRHRSDSGFDVPGPFVHTVTVQPSDLDEFGHANNVQYLRWLEQAAWAHSRALGMDMSAYRRLGAGCVARRHEIDYLAPTFAGDVLDVATWIASCDGRLSMWRAYQVRRRSDGRTVLRGRTHWICVNLRSGRPQRMPPEFVAAYRPHPDAGD